MKTIVFFNNKGGVGKTSLVYHLAWMYSEMGINVIAADFDPQANLTSMFLAENDLINIWPDGEHPDTVFGAIRPIMKGTGDIKSPHVEIITEKLGLIPGDLGLSSFEDKLSDAWPRALGGDEASFRVMSALFRIIKAATEERNASLALIDVGPNLASINRTAMIAANFVVIPLAPDLYSLQGLKNLGPTLRRWREDWQERIKKNPDPELSLPTGDMKPVGYVIMQHAMRSDRPVRAYKNWMNRIPEEYRISVMNEQPEKFENIDMDPYYLSPIKHYRSLMPMAMEVKKPIFHLKPADGAIGSHMEAVQDCAKDFRSLALKIAQKCDIEINKLINE